MKPQTNSSSPTEKRNALLVGTKTGKCELCKVTKKLLLLKYGFILCEDCLNICINILENLQIAAKETELSKPLKTQKRKAAENRKAKTPSSKTNQTKRRKPNSINILEVIA